MKIALIGPGIMPIPNLGDDKRGSWGAVEKVCWNQKLGLEKLGHEVILFNDKNVRSVAEQINTMDFDFIHSHYDEHVPVLNHFLKKKFVSTAHYGFLLRPDKQDHGYYDHLFNAALNAPGIMALSPNIAQNYVNRGAKGVVKCLRNGTDTKSIRFSETAKFNKAICIGQISSRKQQGNTAIACQDLSGIDFVGPIVDGSYRDVGNCRHIGSWYENDVNERLTDYSAMILLSDGEAHALVCGEALAAGLPLIVSDAASENLDRSKPYITVVPDHLVRTNPGEIAKIVENVIKTSNLYRLEARKYAQSKFDWSTICREYIQLAEEFREEWAKSAK